MTQDDVLKMFRDGAEKLGPVKESQREIILALADLLANSRGRLSKEDFERLVGIGSVLYQEGLAQYNARQEMDSLMLKSIDDRGTP
ncbi:hypothetical protein E4K72_01345 [Oxalobacteraceae bacterium OM1]|nr:hypothetical protein E4K72_01345 [Oxalobacteraceae bacterium OM1]